MNILNLDGAPKGAYLELHAERPDDLAFILVYTRDPMNQYGDSDHNNSMDQIDEKYEIMGRANRSTTDEAGSKLLL